MNKYVKLAYKKHLQKAATMEKTFFCFYIFLILVKHVKRKKYPIYARNRNRFTPS